MDNTKQYKTNKTKQKCARRAILVIGKCGTSFHFIYWNNFSKVDRNRYQKNKTKQNKKVHIEEYVYCDTRCRSIHTSWCRWCDHKNQKCIGAQRISKGKRIGHPLISIKIYIENRLSVFPLGWYRLFYFYFRLLFSMQTQKWCSHMRSRAPIYGTAISYHF